MSNLAFLRSYTATRTLVDTVLFLYGPAKTEKKFLHTTASCNIQDKRDGFIPLASAGIAATLLAGGRTARSVF